MKYERKKLLAKLAYLYYIEEKSQSEIATETGIYRTTVSRMLTEAKKEGIVKIEIENFDSKLRITSKKNTICMNWKLSLILQMSL